MLISYSPTVYLLLGVGEVANSAFIKLSRRKQLPATAGNNQSEKGVVAPNTKTMRKRLKSLKSTIKLKGIFRDGKHVFSSFVDNRLIFIYFFLSSSSLWIRAGSVDEAICVEIVKSHPKL